jgi:hypothetical protein
MKRFTARRTGLHVREKEDARKRWHAEPADKHHPWVFGGYRTAASHDAAGPSQHTHANLDVGVTRGKNFESNPYSDFTEYTNYNRALTFQNFCQSIFLDVLQTKGLRGFYSGWTAYLVLALKPAIQILVFERLKERINLRNGRRVDASLTFWEAFVVGALARLVATLICYPFFFARISAQGGAKGGMKRVVLEIWRAKGAGAFYTGIVPELARGVLFHAVNMVCVSN